MNHLFAGASRIFCGAVLGFWASAATAQNFITNGGFETGNFSGWTQSGNTGFTGVNGGSAHSGSFGAFFGPVGSLGFISQTVNLAAGTYRLSYFLNNDGGSPNAFTAQFGAQTLQTLTNAGAFGFTQSSFILRSSGGATLVQFGFRQDPAFWHFDDVELVLIGDEIGPRLAAVSQSVSIDTGRGLLQTIADRVLESDFGPSGAQQVAQLAASTPMTAQGPAAPYGPTWANVRRTSFWFTGGGDRSSWDGGAERATRYSFSFGADTWVMNDWLIGGAFNYGRAHFRVVSEFEENTGRAGEYFGALYAAWKPPAPYYATIVAGYGRSQNETTRSLSALGGSATGNFGADQVFGSVEAGYRWRALPMLLVTPFARFEGAQLWQHSFTETPDNSGTVEPFSFSSRSHFSARSILGARLQTEFDWAATRLGFSAQAGWAHEYWPDRSVIFTSTGIGGASNTATGATPARNAALINVGTRAWLNSHAVLFANFSSLLASSQHNYGGTVGVRIYW